jgi:hypothetical protein
MKKWQLGICITCAVVLAGMFLFNGSAQAAGVVRVGVETAALRGRVESFDVQQQPAAQGQPRVMHNLLSAMEAERREQATRLVTEAAAALKQGAIVIELPGHAAPRNAPRALLTAVEE